MMNETGAAGGRAEDHAVVQVFDEIRRIDNFVRGALAQALPAGLTLPQYEVLSLLERRGDGVTPAEIARALQTPKSALTNTLQRLCESALVKIEECGMDGRKKRVWLAPGGRAAYAATMATIRPKMEHLRSGFTQSEFRDVLPFLRALRTWFHENA
jgi:DNA-binding MarR family transcriptional regulator